MKRKNAVRLINGTVAALLVAGGFLLGRTASGTTTIKVKPMDTETITVCKGDTLWGISSERYEGDMRYYVSLIENLNDLNNSDIYPGQRLIVPVYE